MPCTVRCVTTDCLHTQILVGNKGQIYRSNTASCKTQLSFMRENYRQEGQTYLNNRNEWLYLSPLRSQIQ